MADGRDDARDDAERRDPFASPTPADEADDPIIHLLPGDADDGRAQLPADPLRDARAAEDAKLIDPFDLRSDAVGPANERVFTSENPADDFGEYDLTPDPDPPPPPKPARAKATHVLDDRKCPRCGYALKGLPLNGRCPECGTPVAASGKGDDFAYANADWLGRLVLGARLLFWSLIASIPVGIVLGITTDNAIVSALFETTLTTLGLIGAWLLTGRDPTGRGEDKYGTRRVVARVLIGVGFAAAVLGWLSTLPSLRGYATPLEIAAIGLSLVALAGHPTIALYLAALARRIPDQQLADRCDLAAWGMYGTLATGFAMFLLAGVIALVSWAQGGGNGPSDWSIAGGCIGLCILGVLALVFLGFMIVYLVVLEGIAAEASRFRRRVDAAEAQAIAE